MNHLHFFCLPDKCRNQQYSAASCTSFYHTWLSCSAKRKPIPILQVLTCSHPQHLTVSTVNVHCFLLCPSRSQLCQFQHMSNTLLILKESSVVTVVNAGCLNEGGLVLYSCFKALSKRPGGGQQLRI